MLTKHAYVMNYTLPILGAVDLISSKTKKSVLFCSTLFQKQT